MIATRYNLPLLKDHLGGICAIDTGWLLATLERAAVKAGFVEWWLADYVTSSVCCYLGSFYAKNVVGLGRLQEVIKRALEDIGYEEIARCFQAESPACTISLLECARSIAVLDSDEFYRVLAARIDDLNLTGLPSFHFHDLRACVLYFDEAVERKGDFKSADIVCFVRHRFSTLDWGREVICTIS